MRTAPLLAKLGGLRGRIRRLMLAGSTLMFIVVGGLLVIGSFALDRLFDLPWSARVVLLLLMVGTMLRGAMRFFLEPLRVPLGDDALALYVEKRRPDLGDSLISALQFEAQSEDPANTESRELMGRAITEALEKTRGIDFAGLVDGRSLRRPALAALLLLVLIGGGVLYSPESASIWFDRCIRLEDRRWPPRTRLEVRIANLDKLAQEVLSDGTIEVKVPESSTLRLDVIAHGVVPPSVWIRRLPFPASGSEVPVSIEMPARPGSDTFDYKFGRLTSDFEFWVEGGDDRDGEPRFRILVRSAPRIDELLVDYDYPDYINATGMADRKDVREYNVMAPAGTKVAMRFRSSSPLQSFDLVFDAEGKEAIRLSPAQDDPRLFTYAFELDEDRRYSFQLLGENGTASREVPFFNMTAQPDIPPQISIVMPESGGVDVTAGATLPIEFRIEDDYEIGGVDFRWDVDRDGAFANRIALEGQDLTIDEKKRGATAFHALECKGLKVLDADTKELRAVASGDTLYLRAHAFDTRRTTANPLPNVADYPSPIVLRLREPVEIERELVRAQVRLKDLLVRVDGALDERSQTIDDLIATFGDGSRSSADRTDLHALVSAQSLVTSSLSEASRSFVRIWDGYVFNRLDPSNLTETLIAATCARHRRAEGPHYALVGLVVASVRDQVDEQQAVGKLTRIMDLLYEAAEKASPEVEKSARETAAAADQAAILAGLTRVRTEELALHETVRALIGRMEDWEDFQDVVQSLKDMIELQKGLNDRMKRAIR